MAPVPHELLHLGFMSVLTSLLLILAGNWSHFNQTEWEHEGTVAFIGNCCSEVAQETNPIQIELSSPADRLCLALSPLQEDQMKNISRDVQMNDVIPQSLRGRCCKDTDHNDHDW